MATNYTVTTVRSGNIIALTWAGDTESGTAGDWTSGGTWVTGAQSLGYGGYPQGMVVKTIIWYPGGADDILVINEGSTSGATILKSKAAAVTDHKVFTFGEGVLMHPYIDISGDTTITAGSVVTFIIK